MTTRPEGVSQAVLARALRAFGHNAVSPPASYGGRQVATYYYVVRAALSHGDHFAAAGDASRLGGRGALVSCLAGMSSSGGSCGGLDAPQAGALVAPTLGLEADHLGERGGSVGGWPRFILRYDSNAN
eukprot:10566391-Lingulodinium_polyedra.AAC.1